jgi:hypothetical protein
MATSGTAVFNLDLREIIEEAGERCGYEVRTGYDFQSARRSLNLLFADWANRGLNMWTFDQQSIPLLPGVATYDLPEDTVDVMDAAVRTMQQGKPYDLPMNRISVATYQAIPNKTVQGRPLQMFIERRNTPRVNLWPVPDNTAGVELVYWRLRRMEDVGYGNHNADLPFRFLPALVAGLAYYLSMKLPGGMERLGALKAVYDETLQLAMDEDREKAPVRFVPGPGWL